MGKIIVVFAVACMALSALAAAPVFAQEEGTDYGYGTVKEVRKDAKEIVVKEYDWESDAESDVVYSVSNDVVVENETAWFNIKSGKDVYIEYTVGSNGKKIAKYISVYEPDETAVE